MKHPVYNLHPTVASDIFNWVIKQHMMITTEVTWQTADDCRRPGGIVSRKIWSSGWYWQDVQIREQDQHRTRISRV